MGVLKLMEAVLGVHDAVLETESSKTLLRYWRIRRASCSSRGQRDVTGACREDEPAAM
jgi:hypothetical protein